MGDLSVKSKLEGEQRRTFMRHLLTDLRALDHMLAEGMFEIDVRRIGAEQEMFLVDPEWRPACKAVEILEDIDDDQFTTELGLFNLEVNLEPQVFEGKCLSVTEAQIEEKLAHCRKVARDHDCRPLLTGILPTLRKSDLGLDNMTPLPRYRALNDAMSNLRGGAYEFHIKGVDELLIKHESLMLEACNASFQAHFQVRPEEFANLYNISQVVIAPVLAAGANSPLLFGRRLWHETRIALFQQSVDTRSSLDFLRERSPRVMFGRRWVRESVLELFQEDIARFRALVSVDLDTDALSELESGDIPTLKALCLHNSTVYRWNRACYGLSENRPHLRIENRVLPSGPTVADEVANAAFWYGLLCALSWKIDDITRVIEFEDAKMNFTAAARSGLGAQFRWLDGETLPAADLICERLVPKARDGLVDRGIDAEDADRYLGIIEKRVSSGRTGASWLLHSLGSMRGRGGFGEQLNALTAATLSRQEEGKPVSEWRPARLEEAGGWKQNFAKVDQYMSTDLFTVQEDESMDLAAYLMDWERIRHVPVEDHQHRLVGLLSYRTILKMVSRGQLPGSGTEIAVAEAMIKDPFTISPDASTLEAIEMMRRHNISCLPVVKGDQLVGIITEHDFMNVARELLEEQLRDG